MDLGFLAPAYAASGPVATAYLDTTSAVEGAAAKIAARWRARREELAAQGADEATLEAMGEAAGRDHGAGAGQVLVGGGGRLLLDGRLPAPPRRETASWGPLPDVLPMVSVLADAVPYTPTPLPRPDCRRTGATCWRPATAKLARRSLRWASRCRRFRCWLHNRQARRPAPRRPLPRWPGLEAWWLACGPRTPCACGRPQVSVAAVDPSTTAPGRRTGLVVLVPAAEPAAGAWRGELDPSAGYGMPAHITVLFPWFRLRDLGLQVLTELAALAGDLPAFDVTFDRVDRFPETLWLAPTPVEPFVELTEAVRRSWPEYPPFGGRFDVVVPHPDHRGRHRPGRSRSSRSPDRAAAPGAVSGRRADADGSGPGRPVGGALGVPASGGGGPYGACVLAGVVTARCGVHLAGPPQ